MSVAGLLSGGCAGRPPTPVVVDAAADCRERLAALEALATSRGITPAEPRAMAAYPELASNRVLGHYDPVAMTPREREDWLGRLAEAGERRRALLLDALAASAAAGAGVQQAAYLQGERERLDACARELAALRRRQPGDWRALADAARVPDEYQAFQRVLGLYPLMALPVGRAIAALHEDVRATFAVPLEALPVQGELRRWVPAAAAPAAAPAMPPDARDTLGMRIARIDDATLEALFVRHAPVLEIDTLGSFDEPGVVRFDAGGRALVDPARPTAYRYARVMPFAGELRLQLVYVFWFEARPKGGAFDTLGGAIDGLVWRVTLDHDGRVLLYDSIHPCGCYHHLFPADDLVLREEAIALAEPPLVPQGAPRVGPGQRVVLRIAGASHYLQRVYANAALPHGGGGYGGGGYGDEDYSQASYDMLYALPGPDGPRSFFGAHGLVPGTQRGERLYLWPMGVRSPGAMRERGRQATAFLGRRHFDDATLLDDFFRRADGVDLHQALSGSRAPIP